jgi:hypothetical protein
MPAAPRAVELSQTVAADATGTASVLFYGPGPPYTRIAVDSIALLVVGSTVIPQAAAYDGAVPTNGRVRASTRLGDHNTLIGDNDVLFAGQTLLVQWTGATPGASCNAVLRGTAS